MWLLPGLVIRGTLPMDLMYGAKACLAVMYQINHRTILNTFLSEDLVEKGRGCRDPAHNLGPSCGDPLQVWRNRCG